MEHRIMGLGPGLTPSPNGASHTSPWQSAAPPWVHMIKMTRALKGRDIGGAQE